MSDFASEANDGPLAMLMNGGASGFSLNDKLSQHLEGNMLDHEEVDVISRKIVIAGQQIPLGTVTGRYHLGCHRHQR